MLTLSGYTGNVVRWEYSTDGGINWISIGNTTPNYIYSNIIITTVFRAIVQNGACSTTASSTATLTVDPVSVGGTISGGTTACGGANTGTLDLFGYVGSIQSWQSSIDGGTTWTTIANTTANLNYLNILSTTIYRVIVASGVCSNDTSLTATIVIDAPPIAGTLSASDTVCAGANAGTLNLVGYLGTIINWETSTDGVTWFALSNTTASQSYLNLNISTYYRAFVNSGVCLGTISNIDSITVDPKAVGGLITGGTTVCDTINSGTLTLTGNIGTVSNWESSTDGGLTWSNIANITTTQSYTNLLDSTWFRAIISSGTCGNDTSSIGIINVNPKTIGGIVSISDTVCSGANNGTLHLAGYIGTITGWESSVDGGFTWTPISNSTDSLIYNNLSVTTMYHANVKSGICNADTSFSATITVNPVSVGGTISGAVPGCEGANSGTLNLTGYVGSILNWQSSIDGGLTWSPIVNVTASQTYLNLIDTTWYLVLVQSGVCAPISSASSTVIVYPKPVAVYSADTVCFGNFTTFTNTSTINSGFIQFNQWDFADGNNSMSTNPTHLYATAGTFISSLLLTSDKGCLDTATVNVLVNPLPPSTITASGPLQFCAGDSVMLSAAIGGYSYLWSTTDTIQSITVMAAGNYVLTINDTLTGCSAMDSVSTIVYPSPSVSAGPDINLSLGSTVDIVGSGAGIITWAWFPNTGLTNASISDPTAGPTTTTMYTLTGTDINGCTDIDTMTITVLIDYNVTISNMMTPNDDGYNDRWIIQNIENYPNTKVVVVNREGQEVFKSDAYDNNWDGSNKYGKGLPDGTYYYIIKFENDEKIYKGAITILKEGTK
ncbi:MAG: gliding motility-associated C-terminal domain-containing protein [Bacteroidetes bacterium]|nr:gliding motility-associated C-terminal domain-containing protein [Bacteroidota bacterium]